jgi:conjugative transfer signal peptidase TraF
MAERSPCARRRPSVFDLSAGAIALVTVPVLVQPAPRIVWNASASAPIGLYWVSPGAKVRPGDMVVARLDSRVGRFAAKRQYLPPGVPLVKRVAAVAPSRVCALGARLTIDGRFAASRLASDGAGRPLAWWSGCRALRDGEVLLMGDTQRSFDGRYFGPTPASDLIGRARLVWRA